MVTSNCSIHSNIQASWSKTQLSERKLSFWLKKTDGTNKAETFVLFSLFVLDMAVPTKTDEYLDFYLLNFVHLFCSQHKTPFPSLSAIREKLCLEVSPELHSSARSCLMIPRLHFFSKVHFRHTWKFVEASVGR